MPTYSTNPKFCLFLVGGFNPSEKYDRQIATFPQVRMNIKKYLKPPPRFYINLFFGLQNLHQQTPVDSYSQGHTKNESFPGSAGDSPDCWRSSFFEVGAGTPKIPKRSRNSQNCHEKTKTHFIPIGSMYGVYIYTYDLVDFYGKCR